MARKRMKILMKAKHVYRFMVSFQPDEDTIMEEGKTYEIIAPFTLHQVLPAVEDAINLNLSCGAGLTECKVKE